MLLEGLHGCNGFLGIVAVDVVVVVAAVLQRPLQLLDRVAPVALAQGGVAADLDVRRILRVLGFDFLFLLGVLGVLLLLGEGLGVLGVGSVELVQGGGGGLAVGSDAVGGLEGDQRSLGLAAKVAVSSRLRSPYREATFFPTRSSNF